MSTPENNTTRTLKWITYDAELENAAELIEATSEAARSASTSEIRFLHHDGPIEKSDEFRRTVRMHVMRDYRARMREEAAGGSGSSSRSSCGTALSRQRARTSSRSPPQPKKTNLSAPRRKIQKPRSLRQSSVESQRSSLVPSPLPSPLPSPGIWNVPNIIYDMAPGSVGTPGTEHEYCSDESDGGWSQYSQSVINNSSTYHSREDLVLSHPPSPAPFATPGSFHRSPHFPGMSPSSSPAPHFESIRQYVTPPDDPPECGELLEHCKYQTNYPRETLPTGTRPRTSTLWDRLLLTLIIWMILDLLLCGELFPFDNDANPIKQYLLPYVSTSLATLYAVMAVSEVHIANITGRSKVMALSYRQTAISLLNQEMEAATISAGESGERNITLEGALVASFFIGGFDHVDCGISNRQTWMAGISLLVEICGGPEHLGFDGVLFHLLSWFDLIGSSLTLSPPTLAASYTKSPTPTTSSTWPPTHFSGCPRQIMSIITTTATFVSSLRDGAPSNPSLTSDLESQLLSYNSSFDPPPTPHRGWHRSYESYRLAALLYLHTMASQLPLSDHRVQSTVSSAVEELRSLGSELAEFEKPMVWAYFIVGSAAVREDQRAFIEERMMQMGRRSGVGAWEGAVKVLREMWASGQGLWETLVRAEEAGVGFLFV